MTLTRTMWDHWHAVERDLISLGYRADDIGTPKLTLWELISIVVAAPPGSAVHFAIGAWTKESEMLANLSEQQAGLLSVNGRYPRPGVEYRPRTTSSVKPAFGVVMQPMSPEEFLAKRKAFYAKKVQK